MVCCDLGGGDRNWCASSVRPMAVRSHLLLQEADEARMVFQLSVELGGYHAVQDDWNTVIVTSARRNGTWRLRGRTNRANSTGNHPNSDRCNQTVDRDGRATLFQSRECQPPVGREEQRLCGQQHCI